MPELNTLKSIIKFKNKLISDIPYTPNNNESKEYLFSLDIGDLIHIYDFWQQRLISSTPRQTIVSSKVRNTPLYVQNKIKINNLLEQVKIGLDINQYLSHSAHSGTFNVKKFKDDRDFNSFRDEILICEGFYHLHLEEFPKRTNEVLIVHVTTDTFEIVQVAKHDLLEGDAKAFAEYEKHINQFLHSKDPSGNYYIGGAGGGMQNLAGSSIQSSFNQIRVRKILQHVELECGGIEEYAKKLYLSEGRNTEYVKPEWRMQHRELIIYEKKNKRVFLSENLTRPCYQSHM